MHYLSLFVDYIKIYMKTKLTYRSDLWIEIVSDLLFQGLNLLFILVVFMHTDLLGDWSRDEMIFIYGYFMVPYGLFTSFFNMWNFTERYIIKGEMDRVLTRPAHNLFQLVLENIDPSSLFGALSGIIIMVYAGTQLGLDWAWYDPFVLLLLVLSSMMVYFGVYVSLIAIGFFTDSQTGILPLVWNLQNYGRYPVDIYNRVIRFSLTWVLPFAFVGVHPASYFLKKGEWQLYAFLTPLMGVAFFALALWIWNVGVNRYRGAGS
jgi:ABC-2 type transport system permease protein